MVNSNSFTKSIIFCFKTNPYLFGYPPSAIKESSKTFKPKRDSKYHILHISQLDFLCFPQGVRPVAKPDRCLISESFS